MKVKKAAMIRKNNDTPLDKALRSTIYGALFTVAIGMFLLLASTAIALALPDPTSLTIPIGYFTRFATAFFGGFACAKLNKHSPYLTSLLCGAVFTALTFILSLALPHTLDSGMDIWQSIILYALSFFTFPAGALAGIKASKPTKKRRKR